ncbi:right-handed parallel beta-helix repeat-containing protein [Klenkia taihuensis]|uniref:ATPase family associated with various cellular activities (AAA) n=1 Tax=Klenkia taihuensis TaxID=1225127 RepID=A0A1I1IT06_9ACTN|nr:right-handed parallel beta-helix repeat-containing protein [Klenkia taihuensis]GHE14705.1 hypothetical protein GCM10011381_42290 [Klenkia taihuensis]SFC37448.1 ATPase family associated with various cellular activities (AAA) [Klenkia taihuensis]
MSQTLQVDPGTPGAYPTIGEAVGDAPTGATVVVAPGSYPESLQVLGKDVTIRAADGAGEDAEVVLAGSGDYLATLGVRDATVVVEGLVVVGGDTTAVEAEGARLTLRSVTVRAGHGAGVRLSDRSTLTATGCTVTGGTQGLVLEESGGTVEDTTVRDSGDDAVLVRLGADPVLRNLVVVGGHRGVYAYQGGHPVLEGCDISGTAAAGVHVTQSSSAKLTRCKLHACGGPGVLFDAGTTGTVDGCRTERTAEPGVSVDPGAQVEVLEAAQGAAAGVGAAGAAEQGDPERVDELLAELDAMVGLEGVKAEVRAIIDEIQVNEWRRSAGLAVGGASHHLVFAGAPGTGKTTVGRIYGQLLAALGALPGGPLREVSRRDLVGQYIGHTAEKTAAVFDEAAGGVVFLDEAYTLSRQAGGGNDFGQEAIDMIVKLMEDRRDTLAVIAAGYTAEMQQFLDANPGLASRFVKTVEFENYGADELVLIITRMIGAGDYRLADDAVPLLEHHFATVQRGADFGNAREARKLFEKLRKVQSQRLRALGARPALADLQTLTAEDVSRALADG